MTIAVVVATYGDRAVWDPLAERALDSVAAQTSPANQVIRHHGPNLRDARNWAVTRADTDWVVVLDADDCLDAGYLAAMRATTANLEGDWLIQPATLGVVDGVADDHPVMIPARRSLLEANWMVIGTMFRRDQHVRLGGYSHDEVFEDWDWHLRAWLDGAQLAVSPDAIYQVNVNPAGRNQPTAAVAGRCYTQIRNRHTAAVRAKGLT